MSKFEVKKLELGSVLKNFPFVFVVLGFLLGILSLYIFPSDAVALGALQKIASLALFTVIYAVVMTVIAIVIVIIYNFTSDKMGGIEMILEQKED